MTEHPGDLLSALLDGELDSAEAAAVRAHVAGCTACERELDDVRTARRLLRTLPAVQPLVPLVPPSIARPRGRVAVANVAASVAAGVALLLVSSTGVGSAALRPEVGGAVDAHASTISALQAGGLMRASSDRLVPDHDVPPTTAPRRSIEGLPAPFDAPRELAGYALVDAYRAGDRLHLLYRRGSFGLSVFEQRGRVDWDALHGEEGSTFTVNGHRAWRWDAPPCDGRLLVMEVDGMVVTVVGDEPGDAVLEAAGALPGGRDLSIRQRVDRAVARALELLGPLP